MKKWFRLALFAFFSCLLGSASAADETQASSDSLQWRCWYDQQVHISCVVDEIPRADTSPSLALPVNLPPIVVLMRTNPGQLRNMIVQIPLLSEPEDMEFTALLAKASVCGSRRDCTVNFSEKQPPMAEIVALLNKHVPDRRQSPQIALALLGMPSADFE